jgi:PKD repeat protein
MRRLRLVSSSLVALALAASCTDAPTGLDSFEGAPRFAVAVADPVTFCNPARIVINQAGASTPYPSSITASGIPSGPFKVTATLNGLSHTAAADIDMLLVGPAGQNVMLMSDAGGSANFQNVTVTFDDNAPASLPPTGTTVVPGGTYKPTNVVSGAGDFIQGVPGPFGASFAVFAGTDPNGTWRLHIWDDITFEAGSIAAGWCVTIVMTNSAPVANAGGPYSSAEGSPITFDGTASTDPDNDIVSYAWDFGDGETGSGPTVQHTYANAGAYTVTLTVTDDDGVTSQTTATATIADVAPTATLDAPLEVGEGGITTVALISPSAEEARYAFDCGSGFGEIGTVSSAACPTTDNGTLTVRGRVIDAGIDDLFTEYSAEINVTNVTPVVRSVSLPPDPVAVNAPVTLGAAFTDAGTGDSHTGSFQLGAGGPASGAIVESNGSGSMSAVVGFAQAGVYTITASVTDDDGGTGVRSSALDVPAFLVVYDPSGSFVTGGGWISSPAGAFAAEPTFTGKASFGFVAKYKPGASTPSGDTEFQFKAGSLSFKSTTYDWLVVGGAHAKYKGEGTINGGGSYGFMITAVDGDRPGGADEDAFRIKIWNLITGAIVYDNKIGEGDDSAAATSLGGGSIVIHK